MRRRDGMGRMKGWEGKGKSEGNVCVGEKEMRGKEGEEKDMRGREG